MGEAKSTAGISPKTKAKAKAKAKAGSESAAERLNPFSDGGQVLCFWRLRDKFADFRRHEVLGTTGVGTDDWRFASHALYEDQTKGLFERWETPQVCHRVHLDKLILPPGSEEESALEPPC